MSRLVAFVAFFSLLAGGLAAAPQGHPDLLYTVSANDALGNDGVIELRVDLDIGKPSGTRTVVAIPVWTPGSYRLRPFPERISELVASADNREVPVQRLDRATWQISHGATERLRVSYRVELREGDRFMLRGNKRRCITYEGPAVYLYLRDHLRAPCRVRFALPAQWQVASGLTPQADGSYLAADYDVLADCPVKLGLFQRFGFTAHGKPIEVVVDGPGDVEFNAEAWLANIHKIVDAGGKLFGGLPFDRYVFLYTASPGGDGGGLEHLNSTCIGVSVNQLRRSATAAMDVTAHEFFHVWNVKRIRPLELGPFDYSRPNRTDWLWLMEGTTSYYEGVLQVRAGLSTPERFFADLGRRIAAFESAPARAHVSSAQASYRVWDEVPADRSLDYYTSGEVLGFLLDLEIRHHSKGQKSLDDLMRGLLALCTQQGRGFTRQEVETMASDLAGADLRPWFDQHAFGTVVPDYAQALQRVGMTYSISEQTAVELRGLQRLGEGAGYSDPDAGNRGRIDGRAGQIVSIDGEPVQSYAEVEKKVGQSEVGKTITLGLRTLAGEAQVRVTLTARTRKRVRIDADPQADAAALALREAMTKG